MFVFNTHLYFRFIYIYDEVDVDEIMKLKMLLCEVEDGYDDQHILLAWSQYSREVHAEAPDGSKS